MEIGIIIFGFLFGFAMQYAHLNKFNTISGMSMLKDYTMAKTMGFAIGLGAILIYLEVQLGWATYHIKPLMLGGNILGGLIFGIGMSILGYCPGTLPISLGQGATDALIGILGGLTGGLIFTYAFPSIKPLLGPDYGTVSVFSMLQSHPFWLTICVFAFGGLLMYGAYYIHKKEQGASLKWLTTGIAFAIINAVLILNAGMDRPLGASTAYPYLADLLVGFTESTYFKTIASAGHWEVYFLIGAFLAGLIPSLVRKDFKLRLVQERWEQTIGRSKRKRIIWAFVGGFLLIFGARIAGGCASGHILSGGMQLGMSSMLFSFFTFLAFFITGKYFYHTNKQGTTHSDDNNDDFKLKAIDQKDHTAEEVVH